MTRSKSSIRAGPCRWSSPHGFSPNCCWTATAWVVMYSLDYFLRQILCLFVCCSQFCFRGLITFRILIFDSTVYNIQCFFFYHEVSACTYDCSTNLSTSNLWQSNSEISKSQHSIKFSSILQDLAFISTLFLLMFIFSLTLSQLFTKRLSKFKIIHVVPSGCS